MNESNKKITKFYSSACSEREIMKNKIILIFFWVSLGLAGCRDADNAPMRTPDFHAPIVTGLYVTNHFATVETWRDPSYHGQVGAFPSITSLSTDVRFILSQTSDATVWVTPAVMKGEELLSSAGGGLYAQIPGAAIWTFPKQQYSGGLTNVVEWDLKDDQGNKVKPGFYRVYVQAEDDVLFSDMFVYHDCSDIPPDIKTNICN